MSDNIVSIVNDISKLSLLEVRQLIEGLCEKLNLPDPSSMPVMSAVAASEDNSDAGSGTIEYNLSFCGISDGSKATAALIKAIRTMCQEQGHEDTGLMTIKKGVDNASKDNPMVIAKNIEKEVFDKYKEELLKFNAVLSE